MPRQSMPVKDATRIAQKIADEMQFELVDVELAKEPTGRFLRFFIEKPDGISVDELEAYHRRIQPLVENVDYDYMEVSSPGVDRPLKTPRDFERAAGLRVEARTYRPINGAKLFVGQLVGLEDGVITMIDDGGATLQFKQKEVALIRPLIEFDEEDLQDDVPVDDSL